MRWKIEEWCYMRTVEAYTCVLDTKHERRARPEIVLVHRECLFIVPVRLMIRKFLEDIGSVSKQATTC